MKIAYITNATDPFGGASKALFSIITELTKHGVEPLVITPDKNGIYESWAELGIPTMAINYRQSVYPPIRNIKDFLFFPLRLAGRIFLDYKAIKKLHRVLVDEEVQLVHSNTSVVRIGDIAASKAGIPHIYHVREYGDIDFSMHYYPSWKSIHKRMNASYTLCITRGVQEHHGLSVNPKSKVVYDGVMPQQPSMSESPAKKSYFLYAGRIEPAKGLDQLLDGYIAYVKSAKTPLPLYVAGASRMPLYMDSIKKQIKDSGIEDKVKFLGLLDDIYGAMRNAAAIVIASPFEGFGFCMAEAMFNKCLVIGRNTAGTKEQFDNGVRFTGSEIGLRYNSNDELTEMLSKVTTADAHEFDSMKELAFKIVNSMYTSENCAREVLEVYNKILNHNDTIHS